MEPIVDYLGRYQNDAQAALNPPQPVDDFVLGFTRGLQNGLWDGAVKLATPGAKELEPRDYQGQGTWINGKFTPFAELEDARVKSDAKRHAAWHKVKAHNDEQRALLNLTAEGRTANKVGYFLGKNAHEIVLLGIFPVGSLGAKAVAYTGRHTVGRLAGKVGPWVKNTKPVKFVSQKIKGKAAASGASNLLSADKRLKTGTVLKEQISQSTGENIVIEAVKSKAEDRSYSISNVAVGTGLDLFGTASLDAFKRMAGKNVGYGETFFEVGGAASKTAASGALNSASPLADRESVKNCLKQTFSGVLEEAYKTSLAAGAHVILNDADEK